MYMVTVDLDACVGCGECARACPAKILTLVDGKIEVGDCSECLGCQSCAMVCPVAAVTVQEF